MGRTGSSGRNPAPLPSLSFRSMLAAVLNGDVKELAELIRQDPGFNVNQQDEDGWTLLHHAFNGNHGSVVIPLLLAHPDIDVNAKTVHGYTPFFYAGDGRPSCVHEMLKDSRVKVNEPDNHGFTPLWWAAARGHLDVIKWWVASGREMDLGEPGDIHKTDAIGRAKNWGKTEVASLLQRFKENSEETRSQMRVELGLDDALAAEMFALVVFVSNGLLQIKDTTPSPAARYFSIASQLPLELQMVMCHRVVESDKEIIPGKESEAAFKELARKLW